MDEKRIKDRIEELEARLEMIESELKYLKTQALIL